MRGFRFVVVEVRAVEVVTEIPFVLAKMTEMRLGSESELIRIHQVKVALE